MMRIVYIQTVRWWNIVQNAKDMSQQRLSFAGFLFNKKGIFQSK